MAAPGGVCLRAASAGGWLAASALLQAGPGRLFGASALTVPCLDPLGLLLDEQQGLLELGDAIGDAQVRACTSVRALLLVHAGCAPAS